jgi:hypothetical protein
MPLPHLRDHGDGWPANALAWSDARTAGDRSHQDPKVVPDSGPSPPARDQVRIEATHPRQLGHHLQLPSPLVVEGTFIWTPSHDQRRRSLSTASSFVAPIPVGSEPQSRRSVRREVRTNDLGGRRSVELPGDSHQCHGVWLSTEQWRA